MIYKKSGCESDERKSGLSSESEMNGRIWTTGPQNSLAKSYGANAATKNYARPSQSSVYTVAMTGIRSDTHRNRQSEVPVGSLPDRRETSEQCRTMKPTQV